METDYFPLEGVAYTFPGEASEFRDNRLALIEDFLAQETLTRWQREGIDGSPVLSIYSEQQPVAEDSSWVTQSIPEALLSFSRPFVADLRPVSRAIRMDFVPESLLPVGHGEVVWDGEGNEHVIIYRSFAGAEIMSTTEAGAVFQQEVPESAFQATDSNMLEDVELVTGLTTIIGRVDYPVYALPNTTRYPVLASATLALPDSVDTLSPLSERVAFGTIPSIGVQLHYRERNGAGVLTLTQGPTSEMSAALRQSRPAWTQAERQSLTLGQEPISVWKLTGPDTERIRYIAEVGGTILYIDAQAIHSTQVLDYIQSLKLVGQ